MMHCNLDMESLKIDIFKTFFWEEEGLGMMESQKKSNVDNTILDDPTP